MNSGIDEKLSTTSDVESSCDDKHDADEMESELVVDCVAASPTLPQESVDSFDQ
jgi:hypothetical protein